MCWPLTSSLLPTMPGLSGTMTIQSIFPGAVVAIVLIRGAMLVLVAMRGMLVRYRPAVNDLMGGYKREGVILGDGGAGGGRAYMYYVVCVWGERKSTMEPTHRGVG